MKSIDVSAAVSDLARLEADTVASIRQALGQSVAYAEQLAKHSTKFNDQTHNLRNSIRRGQHSTWSMFVKAGDRRAPYALFVEENTKAHEIRPKMGGNVSGPVRPGQGRRRGAAVPLLVFKIAGQWRSAKVVKHPGTTGTHFMRDARDQAESKLHHFVEAGLNHLLAR